MLGGLIGAPRASLLRALASGEKSVSELVDATTLSQPNISNHLARLRVQGLVQRRRVGRRVYYSLIDRRVRSLIESEEIAQTIDLDRMLDECAAMIEGGRLEDLEQLLLAAGSSGVPWRKLAEIVMLPLLRAVARSGDGHPERLIVARWLDRVAERVLCRLTWDRRQSRTVSQDAPLAIVACPEGEVLLAPARLASDQLYDAGWRVAFIGCDLPPAALAAAVTSQKPRLIVLSVCSVAALPAVRRTANAVRDAWHSKPGDNTEGPLLALLGDLEEVADPDSLGELEGYRVFSDPGLLTEFAVSLEPSAHAR